MYYNVETGLKIVPHVDDFLVVGVKMQCGALLADLKRDFEVDGEVVGLDRGEVPEVFCLGRVVRATPQGLEVKADKRLALKIVDETNLVGGKGVDNPGGAVESKGGAGSSIECRGVDILSQECGNNQFISSGSRRLVVCQQRVVSSYGISHEQRFPCVKKGRSILALPSCLGGALSMAGAHRPRSHIHRQ